MDNSVVIKGSANGITVVLDSSIDFALLKQKVIFKFQESAKFLGNCKTALAFEGRRLSDSEELELLNAITENTNLNVVCIISRDEQKNVAFENVVKETLMDFSGNTARFYKGNLRSGQDLRMEQSIIVIGDVNPGANIISDGNIIVLGSLKGTAFAGASGNRNAFVLALDMNPMQIRIADTIARAPDSPDKNAVKEPKVAFLEDENIYIEPVTKSVLNDLKID